MKADPEAVQKRRAFLSRTGIVVLGALPAGAGLTTPRSVLAGGCGAETIAKGGAGALVTIGGVVMWEGGPVGAVVGIAVMSVGVKIVVDSGVYKSCVKPKLDELKDRIEKF